MIYDLSNELARVQFETYCKHLADKRCRVELTEKKGKRTLKQNRYLHLILSYFALQYGERMEWIKQEFFKRFINPDIFLIQKEGRGGRPILHTTLLGRPFHLGAFHGYRSLP